MRVEHLFCINSCLPYKLVTIFKDPNLISCEDLNEALNCINTHVGCSDQIKDRVLNFTVGVCNKRSPKQKPVLPITVREFQTGIQQIFKVDKSTIESFDRRISFTCLYGKCQLLWLKAILENYSFCKVSFRAYKCLNSLGYDCSGWLHDLRNNTMKMNKAACDQYIWNRWNKTIISEVGLSKSEIQTVAACSHLFNKSQNKQMKDCKLNNMVRTCLNLVNTEKRLWMYLIRMEEIKWNITCSFNQHTVFQINGITYNESKNRINTKKCRKICLQPKKLTIPESLTCSSLKSLNKCLIDKKLNNNIDCLYIFEETVVYYQLIKPKKLCNWLQIYSLNQSLSIANNDNNIILFNLIFILIIKNNVLYKK